MLINEVNMDTPRASDSDEFIEFKITATSKNENCNGNNYKAILVRGISTKEAGQTDLFAILGGMEPNKNGYIIIGSPSKLGILANVTLQGTWEQSNIYYPAKFNTYSGEYARTQLSLFDVLPNGNKFPEGLILIKVDGEPAQKIYNSFQSLKYGYGRTFNKQMKELIKPYIVDLVVFSRRAKFNKCSLFEDFVEEYKGKQYVLTDYDSEEIGDRTVNRCTELLDPFLPKSFKLGKPTPGKDNDCSGPHFILSEEIFTMIGRKNIPVTDQAAAMDEPGIQTLHLHGFLSIL